MAHFVPADRRQSMLLPPDLKDWVPEDDLAHFVIEAVEAMAMESFRVNPHSGGSPQYPPRMMLALLIYCYANGIFSSRRVERATYRDIGVRYVSANTHPDHDTLCKFRRENEPAIAACFEQVLLLARELKLLRVGTVSVDGTKVQANASRHRNVRYDRARELSEQLRGEVRELLARAERADASEEPDPQRLPEEIGRRERLRAKLEQACQNLERRRQLALASERREYESKVAARQARSGRRRGKRIKAPRPDPEPRAQSNLTDPDSGLMRTGHNGAYVQAYNAQAVVDAQGSQLVVGTRVSTCASDANELSADVQSVSRQVGRVRQVLADSGYANGLQVEQLQKQGIDVLVAVQAPGRRTHDLRPVPVRGQTGCREKPAIRAAWRLAMREKLSQPQAKRTYALRQCTVEPVFGIVKEAMGFRRFLTRGVASVSNEWRLVNLAYNFRRLHNLRRTMAYCATG